MFYIGLYRENHEKIFLSETTRRRALIFGMKHHLVFLCQVFFSNYMRGARNGPTSGVTCVFLHRPTFVYREKHEKILSETIRLRALIFGM